MSRCSDWNNALNGVMNYLEKNNLATSKNSLSKAKKLIYAFTKEGSFSTRCLFVGKNFNEFKKQFKQP